MLNLCLYLNWERAAILFINIWNHCFRLSLGSCLKCSVSRQKIHNSNAFFYHSFPRTKFLGVAFVEIQIRVHGGRCQMPLITYLNCNTRLLFVQKNGKMWNRNLLLTSKRRRRPAALFAIKSKYIDDKHTLQSKPSSWTCV